MRIEPKTLINEITILFPAVIPHFDKFNINYLKDGYLPLADACENAKIPGEQVLSLLEKLGPPALPSAPQEWKQLSFSELIGFILQKYHEPGYPQLLVLKDLATQAKNSFSSEPQLMRLVVNVHEITEGLKEHMLEEEKFIFPYLLDAEKKLQSGVIPKDKFLDLPFNKHPLSSLSWEHEVADDQFMKLRHMTNGYEVPPDSHNSYSSLLKDLKQLDYSTHEHMHLENDILFQKAILLKILS